MPDRTHIHTTQYALDHYLYGSIPVERPTASLCEFHVVSRLGSHNRQVAVATLTDHKTPVATSGTITHWQPTVRSYTDYYPFGMEMAERSGRAGQYRYSFQAQETDAEVYGPGNAVSYKYRIHDARIGRFFSVDPLYREYPQWAPYVFSGNQIIDAIELEGLEPWKLNWHSWPLERDYKNFGNAYNYSIAFNAQLEFVDGYFVHTHTDEAGGLVHKYYDYEKGWIDFATPRITTRPKKYIIPEFWEIVYLDEKREDRRVPKKPVYNDNAHGIGKNATQSSYHGELGDGQQQTIIENNWAKSLRRDDFFDVKRIDSYPDGHEGQDTGLMWDSYSIFPDQMFVIDSVTKEPKFIGPTPEGVRQRERNEENEKGKR